MRIFLALFVFISGSAFAQLLPAKLTYRDTISRKYEIFSDEKVEQFVKDGLYAKAMRQALKDMHKAYESENFKAFKNSIDKITPLLNQSGLEADSLQLLIHDLYSDALSQKSPYSNYLALQLYDWMNNYYVRISIIEGDESLLWPETGKLRLDERRILQTNLLKHIVKNPEILMEYPAITDANEIESNIPSLFEYFVLSSLPPRDYYYVINDTNYLKLLGETDNLQEIAFVSSNDSIRYRNLYHIEKLNWSVKRYDFFATSVLSRMQEIYSSLDIPEKTKDSIYFESLLYHKDLLKSQSASAHFSLAIAQFYARKAGTFDYKTAKFENYFNLALSEIDASLKAFPESLAKDQLKSLREEVLAKNLTLSFKIQPQPGEASVLSIRYRNLDQAQLRIYKVTARKKTNTYYNPLKDLTVEKLFERELQLDNDANHNYHQKDFILPEFSESGQYLILSGTNPDDLDKVFTIDTLRNLKNIAYILQYAGDLSITATSEENQIRVLVNKSSTGEPLKNIRVKVRSHKQNFEGKTDANGFYTFKTKDQDYRSYSITAFNGNDSSYMSMYSSGRYSDEREKEYRVFTDRAIYRPGQGVYFKILALENKDESFRIVKSHSMNVEVEDYNGTKIFEKDFKSNEFGSASSYFDIPMSGYLPGNFSILVNGSYVHNFRVEEYKRPTFEITFEKVKSAYSFGDSITISGSVNALAGYPISNADVEIMLNPSFYYYRWYYPQPDEDKAEYFTVKTDEKGQFSFTFLAKESKNYYGQYYSVTASVTDISGETHEAITGFAIGKSSINLSLSGLNSEMRSDERNVAYASVTNSQGEAQKEVLVRYTLSEVNTEKRKLISRSQYSDFDEGQFKKTFPVYTFTDETSYKRIAYGTFRHGDSLEINKLVQNNTGHYRIILSAPDAAGDSVRYERTFNFINTTASKTYLNSENWISLSANENIVPGKELKLLIGSSEKDQMILLSIYNKKGLQKMEWVKTNGSKEIKYTYTDADKGGLFIETLTCIDGEYFVQQKTLYFIDKTKALNITLETKRDELTPGGNEKWILHIKNQEKEINDAELLAGMYDASLDAFASLYWQTGFTSYHYFYNYWNRNAKSGLITSVSQFNNSSFGSITDWGPFPVQLTRGKMASASYKRLELDAVSSAPTVQSNDLVSGVASVIAERKSENSIDDEREENDKATEPELKMRDNFQETAFFYPTVYAQEDGSYQLEFTLPDALTRWKLMTFAHTKDLQHGSFQKEFTAKKDLMILANEPRFLRENDDFIFSAKAVNTSKITQVTKVSLRILDPYTDADISSDFGLVSGQELTLDSAASKELFWKLKIPQKYSVIAYELKITGQDFADGERKTLPVLSNRMLIQIAQPFVKNSIGESQFQLNDYSKLSTGAEKLQLTIKLETQTLWSALMSLPYMMEYPYECSEQLFARYFSNVIAQKIIRENPEFKMIVESWLTDSPEAFLSNLEKNPELKQIILTETPWVLESGNEAANKRRLASLFNLNQLENELAVIIRKLKDQKASDGGWGWWKSNESNVYITQHIVAGFGRLKELGVEIDEKIVGSALIFLDNYYLTSYKKLSAGDKSKKTGVSELTVQYLLARSYFTKVSTEATEYYYPIMLENWKDFNIQTQAMIGINLMKQDQRAQAEKIKNSLMDRSTYRPERGRYWNDNKYGYYWYQSPVETESIIVEFFSKMGGMESELSQMQLWLILQKRSNSWENTKASTLACNALLLTKTKMNSAREVNVSFSNGERMPVQINKPENTFIKQGNEISEAYTQLSVSSNSTEPILGSIHLSYLEDLEKIQKSTGAFTVERHYFLVKEGKETEIKSGDNLPVGSKIRVKIQLSTAQDLEYVHIKDSKASGFEAVETMSGYKYDKLYYFQTNRDASTDFFIDHVRKGSYYFEYEVFATGKGTLNAGPVIAECMYAPEFRANTGSTGFVVE